MHPHYLHRSSALPGGPLGGLPSLSLTTEGSWIHLGVTVAKPRQPTDARAPSQYGTYKTQNCESTKVTYYKIYTKVFSQFIHLRCNICYKWLPAIDWRAVVWCTSVSRTIGLLALTSQSRLSFKPTSIRSWEIALHNIKQHCPVTLFAVHLSPNDRLLHMGI